MILYLLISLISIITGLGILKLANIKLESTLSCYLAPVLTLSFWTVFLGVGVLSNYPVKQLWPVGWALTLGLMILGFISLKNFDFKKNWLYLCAVFILPILIMFPYFWWGLTSYLGSGTPDGWAYMAYGQYIWKYTRGVEEGLSPLYEFAAALGQTRFISSATLGFFSPLTLNPGDIQIAGNLFLSWAMFVFAASCMFFASTQKLGNFKIIYLIICVFSGWLIRVLWLNNFDNTLALAFLPTLAGVTTLITPNERKWTIVFALILAATIYCYPEMALVIFFGTGLFLLDQIIKSQQSIRKWIVLILITIALIILMIAPYIKQSILYFIGQFNAFLQPIGERPGEGLFSDLLNRSYWEVGFWGLLSPLGLHKNFVIVNYGLAIILNILTIFGLVNLIKQRQWAISIFILSLFASTLIMIIHYNYSYGAYKLVIFNWWAVCFAIVIGMKVLLAQQRYVNLKIVSLSLVSLAFLLLNINTLKTLYKSMPIKTISYFRQLDEIKPLVGNVPIAVALDNVLANEWAIYFLRSMPIHLTEYRGYMSSPLGVQLMQRGKIIKLKECHFLLTDNATALSKSHLVWSSGPYYLWKLPRKGNAK